MLTLSYTNIKKYAFIALAIPFIVFAIGWLEWYWAVVAVVATCSCVWLGAFAKGKKSQKDNVVSISDAEKKITIKKGIIILLIVIALIWVWQSGIGGFWAQSKDYPWRNAIYRDIVLRDWPVYYELYDGALVYYIGFWLPPALIGKLALLFGANEVVAFQAASVAIYIWSVLLIVILFGLLITLLKADTTKKQLLVVLGFIFFSGLDILGSIEPLGANLYHLEWWANDYQYSSFTTCLFWVFNQCIIPWIAFACLLQEKNIRNFVYLGMMCLFSGPLPFVGFFIFCIAIGVIKGVEAFRNKKAVLFLKDIVSPSNMLATVFIFIFIATYLLSNVAISGGGGLRVSQDSAIVQSESQVSEGVAESVERSMAIDFDAVGQYVMFVLFEVGFFALLIVRKYYKQPLFYVMLIGLLAFPFFKMGGGSDFPMRASIPALFYLYYLVMQFFIQEKHWMQKKGTTNRMLYVLLIVVFLLGSITPLVEFYRGCRQVALYTLDNPMEDYLYTLSGEGPMGELETGYEYANFVSLNPEQETFFRYFAKDLE